MSDPYSSNISLAAWQKVNDTFGKRAISSQAQNKNDSSLFPFRLYIKDIGLSKNLFHQSDQKSYDVALNIIIFDSKLMTFEGQFYSSTKPLTLANKAVFETAIYFFLDRLDSASFLVLEVLSKHKGPGSVGEDVCLGYAATKLVESPDFSQQTIRLIGGSSRSLLFVDDPLKITSFLPEENFITCSLQRWPQLQVLRHLLPSSFLVCASSDIPGVTAGGINPELPSVGRDNFHNPQSLEFSVQCKISNLVIKMRPDVTNVELYIQNNIGLEVEQHAKAVAKMKTTARKIKIGVHNGLRYVAEPTAFNLLLNSDGHLCVDSSSAQEIAMNIPRHSAFALVFQLELTFSEVGSTSVFKKSAAPKVHSVFAGWAAFCPLGMSDGNIPPMLSLPMVSSRENEQQNPDEILACHLRPPISESESSRIGGIILNFSVRLDTTGDRFIPPTAPETPSVRQTIPPVQTLTAPALFAPPLSQASSHPASSAEPQMPLYTQNQYPTVTPRSFRPMTPQSVAPFPDTVIGQQNMWPLEVRHLVDDDQKTTLIGTTVVHRHPTGRNLPVTPVHISMPPLPPLPTAALPRAAYAQLYAAGFPIIRDRHGDLPEVIDPSASLQSHLSSLNFAAEKSDPLQGNEIVFQFLALSNFLHTSSTTLDQPQSVFFTFQFYNFPPIVTDRLLMTCGDKFTVNDINERMSSIFILRAIDSQSGALSVQPPGCQVKFAVDSSVIKPGEEDVFWRYLVTQSLHVDIWDGDSLMLIGSCSIPIKFLLRQGKEAIQMTLEMDIFSTEYGSLTSNIIADVTRAGSARYIDVAAVLKGRLHVRLGNIGFVSEVRPIARANLTKTHGGVSTGRLAVIESQSAHFGGQGPSSLDKRLNFFADQTNRPITGKTRIGQGAHLLEAAGNQALVDHGGSLVGVSLANDLMGAAAAGETVDERARKLERFRKLLTVPDVKAEQAASQAHGAAILAFKHTRELREHNYEHLESYRERTKHQSIISLLCDSITSHHEITASFGRAEYFEFLLRNPTNEQHMVRIESQDPDLSVVTDVSEWRYFRKMLGEPTSVVEERMFNVDASSPLIPEVFIKPREIVRIPFKYQTFKAHNPNQEGGAASKPADTSFSVLSGAKQLSKSSSNFRAVVVNFTSITTKGEHVAVEDGGNILHPLAVLEVNIQLQPHATDQEFRFYAPENAFLRKAIRLPPYMLTPNDNSSTSEQQNNMKKFTIRCSDSSVLAEVRNNGPGEPQDIMLRVAVGPSPNVNNILLAIFADPYLAAPLQIWHLWVHALQRYDVTCVEGETSKFSLVLRGSNSTRLVRCFTSHVDELLVEPGNPFMLVANAVHELSFTLKPLTAGQRLMVVNVVDVSLHHLVRSWLVCVSAEAPAYSSFYDLVLPCGPAGQSHNKKLAYKNPFGRQQTFFLKTNRSDLLALRETSMPQMAPGETRDIGLRFAASEIDGTAEMAVYVNDEHDRNVESVQIRLAYVKASHPGAIVPTASNVVQGVINRRQQQTVA